MIQGHGDDRYRFRRKILADFSSNVYSQVGLEPLKAYLRARLDVIGRYPEPEPYTLEKALAAQLGIDPAAVCVTAGATEAIYLIAHAFKGSESNILQPTFSEYADACRLFAHSVAPVSGLLPKIGRCAGYHPPLRSRAACVGLVEQPVFLFCEGSQQKRVPVAPRDKPLAIE